MDDYRRSVFDMPGKLPVTPIRAFPNMRPSPAGFRFSCCAIIMDCCKKRPARPGPVNRMDRNAALEPCDHACHRLQFLRERVLAGRAGYQRQMAERLLHQARQEGFGKHREHEGLLRTRKRLRRRAARLLQGGTRLRRPIMPNRGIHRRRAHPHGEARLHRRPGHRFRRRPQAPLPHHDGRGNRTRLPGEGQPLLRALPTGEQTRIHARGGHRRSGRHRRFHQTAFRHPAQPLAEDRLLCAYRTREYGRALRR